MDDVSPRSELPKCPCTVSLPLLRGKSTGGEFSPKMDGNGQKINLWILSGQESRRGATFFSSHQKPLGGGLCGDFSGHWPHNFSLGVRQSMAKEVSGKYWPNWM